MEASSERRPRALQLVAIWCYFSLLLALAASQTSNSTSNLVYFNRSDFNSWLQARTSGQQQEHTEKPHRLVAPAQHRASSGYAIEVTPPPPPVSLHYQREPKASRPGGDFERANLSPQSAPLAILSANGSARTGVALANAPTSFDDRLEADDDNLIVSNTCERDHMLVEIRTSKPFHGLVHTLNYRRKLLCTAQGDGGSVLRLSISHALNPSEPQHCGVTRLISSKADERTSGELLSVILAVRLHRNIELSEDKFFALNCTNHCRRPDCSSGLPLASGRLIDDLPRHQSGWRNLERENVADEADLLPAFGRSQSSGRQNSPNKSTQTSDCSVWRSTWILALALCLAIILLGMLISNCIICMSLRRKGALNKQLQQQVETSRKSSSRNADDLESQQVRSSGSERRDESQRRKSRRKSRQIIYDNDDANYALDYNELAARAKEPAYLALQKQKQQHQQQKQEKVSNRSHLASSSRQSGEFR